ncbi:Ankyrin-1-like protein [Aphelenchoides bicaudatus]|nr:Ankyrin-1-like protein [Aphelenchoides bicaudatus]
MQRGSPLPVQNKLYDACRQNNVKEVERLLRTERVDPNTRIQFNNSTCLHLAASEGFHPIVQVLLDYGAETNLADQAGFSPIHLAANRGHLETVRLLINAGADPNRTTETGWSALHYACMGGHLEVVKLLLDIGVKLNADKHGWTALHSAAFQGHQKIVELLLRSGADMKLKTLRGESAWDLANQKGFGNRFPQLRAATDHSQLQNHYQPPFPASHSSPSLNPSYQQSSSQSPYNPNYHGSSNEMATLTEKNITLSEQNNKLTEQVSLLVNKCSQLEAKNSKITEELTLLSMKNVRLQDVELQLVKEKNTYARIVEELTSQIPTSTSAATSSTSEKMCQICEERPINCAILKCGHVFCDICMTRWRCSSTRCPNCQGQIEAVLKLYL